ncbi:hypothetical protein HDE_09168 [Halotydeus destructor]|nr:hypothetical protein HDE_09168 [Halotydeus destructor]
MKYITAFVLCNICVSSAAPFDTESSAYLNFKVNSAYNDASGQTSNDSSITVSVITSQVPRTQPTNSESILMKSLIYFIYDLIPRIFLFFISILPLWFLIPCGFITALVCYSCTIYSYCGWCGLWKCLLSIPPLSCVCKSCLDCCDYCDPTQVRNEVLTELSQMRFRDNLMAYDDDDGNDFFEMDGETQELIDDLKYTLLNKLV